MAPSEIGSTPRTREPASHEITTSRSRVRPRSRGAAIAATSDVDRITRAGELSVARRASSKLAARLDAFATPIPLTPQSSATVALPIAATEPKRPNKCSASS